ncbi:MAG: a-glycosyltransferase, Glycosyltransferase Family 4-like protein [Acidimicrobiales bacterium]|nr:a-glycosyltransferase, Glycosyltransferase Family 4-like protein [Acidimicrobiales bacterium]
MRIVLFCHSLVSDWNHGNAHFLRGVVAELLDRGHQVDAYEPVDGWSRAHLVVDQGADAIADVRRAFPWLRSHPYDPVDVDVAALTDGADLVIVHEWTPPRVVTAAGRARARAGFRLLFHDTHHRTITDPAAIGRHGLAGYDGVLAFGAVLRDTYVDRAWAKQAWTWHEAADVRTFHPIAGMPRRGDLVWVGNWGDGERSAELRELLLEPVRALGLQAQAYGVRYPPAARQALAGAGIRYGGWRANHRVPAAFAAHGVTVHLPRRPYLRALPGIPTIRPFEALACGIPLVSGPWDDIEGLFEPGQDYLVAANGRQMARHLDDVVHDPELAASLRAHGLRTIAARHTCAHRVDELLAVLAELGPRSGRADG